MGQIKNIKLHIVADIKTSTHTHKPIIMAAVLERSRRSNAGTRMAKLIQDAEEEEEDDFYKTTYGGFEEEECDNDYESEEGGEDSFDSDFSLSEHEDEIEEEEVEKKPAKKKIPLFKPKPPPSTAPPKPKVKKPPVKKIVEPIEPIDKYGRMRASTIVKGSAFSKPKPATKTPVRRHPQIPQMRRLTQAELLAEAQITEVQNLASLAQFMQLQEDTKNSKIVKTRYQGPIIRFQSVRMPQYDGQGKEDGFCSRSFLEFTDTKSFPQEYFPSKAKYPKKEVCVVTGLPARYKDPLTGLPYATIDAFRYIRHHRARLKEQMLAKQEKKRKK